jgi:hypothetical protein
LVTKLDAGQRVPIALIALIVQEAITGQPGREILMAPES